MPSDLPAPAPDGALEELIGAMEPRLESFALEVS
jgi:hypothetical protein